MAGQAPPNAALPESSQDSSATPQSSLKGEPPSPPPSVPGSPNYFNGLELEFPDIWAGEFGYDIWGGNDNEGLENSDSVVVVIDIPDSPEVIEISSDDSVGSGDSEDEDESSGSDTSNSGDPDYHPRKRGRWE